MKRVPVVVQGNYGEAFRKSPLSGNCDEWFQVVPSTVLTYRLAHGAGPHVTRPAVRRQTAGGTAETPCRNLLIPAGRFNCRFLHGYNT